MAEFAANNQQSKTTQMMPFLAYTGYIRKKTMWPLKPTVASVVSVTWNGTYGILW